VFACAAARAAAVLSTSDVPVAWRSSHHRLSRTVSFSSQSSSAHEAYYNERFARHVSVAEEAGEWKRMESAKVAAAREGRT
jgi:hypothetical protein